MNIFDIKMKEVGFSCYEQYYLTIGLCADELHFLFQTEPVRLWGIRRCAPVGGRLGKEKPWQAPFKRG